MNRLILIGNGFDLAHGMKTSYSHFLFSYLKKGFVSANNNTLPFEDELIKIQKVESWNGDFEKFEKVKDFKNLITDYHGQTVLTTFNPNLEKNINKSPFNVDLKSIFLKDLISNESLNNWVDIENVYHQKLIKLTVVDKDSSKKIIKLIEDFGLIKLKLIEYLKDITPLKSSREFDKIFFANIEKVREMKENNPRSNPNDTPPNQLLFLNFNYTSTVKDYILNKYISKEEGYEIQIHGSTVDDDNPIIFGYGDEIDENFKKIEDLNNNDLLIHSKSRYYAQTNNYQRLFKFLEQDFYEVYILGHSCGLSDRVMLNAIFENPKCSKIKIFYYQNEKGENNYIDIYQNIARHFSLVNRHNMRLKIVPFPYCEPIIQIK